MSVDERGFTLAEMLVAMAIGSIILLGAVRLLPRLQQQTLRLQIQVQLFDELQQVMQTLEKFVRRAGYCHGQCTGNAIQIQGNNKSCLLLRWDENSNGKWEESSREESEWYGFRLRGHNLEMQRGVARCDGIGWEKLNDPSMLTIEQFTVTQEQQRFRLLLSGKSKQWPEITRHIEHWVSAENL